MAFARGLPQADGYLQSAAHVVSRRCANRRAAIEVRDHLIDDPQHDIAGVAPSLYVIIPHGIDRARLEDVLRFDEVSPISRRFQFSSLHHVQSQPGVVPVEDDAARSKDFDSAPVMRRSGVVAEDLYPVLEANVASERTVALLAVLVFVFRLCERVAGRPADHEINLRPSGETARQVQSVRADLLVVFVEIDADDLSDRAFCDEAVGLLIVRGAGYDDSAYQRNVP